MLKYDEKQIVAAGLIYHNLACSFKFIKCEFRWNLFKNSKNGTWVDFKRVYLGANLWLLPIITIQRYTIDFHKEIMEHTDSLGVHTEFYNPDHVKLYDLLMFKSNTVNRGLISSSRFFVKNLGTCHGALC